MGRRDKRIKILLTIPNFHTAGSGKVLYDLANGLNPEIFDVSIACSHNKGTFFKKIEALGLPIYLIDTTVPLRPYYNLLFRVKNFRTFLKKHQFDIVHSWHWSSDWSETLATRLALKKFVYTKKAMSWGNRHWKIRSLLSSYIITINDEMESFFSYKKHQQLIPLGIDTKYFNPNSYSGAKNDTFKIVTIANLVPVKGVEVLIKALAIIKDENINLDIIGGGDEVYVQKLKTLVQDFNLQSQVQFLGNQTDVRPFLAESDLYVIPTLNQGRKEGMPMALVEAMAMQTLVLGSDISGIKYVLKDFKELLFKANDDVMLSDKILELYHKSPEERMTMAKQLREYCEANFSLENFIASHESLYIELVG